MSIPYLVMLLHTKHKKRTSNRLISRNISYILAINKNK